MANEKRLAILEQGVEVWNRQEIGKIYKPTLTAEEVKRVLSHLEETPRLFALLIVVTGMRIGEALALRWMNMPNCKSQ